MRQLQIQTCVPGSAENGSFVIEVPFTGTLSLVGGYRIMLYVEKTSVGFYIGKGGEEDGGYYGDEFLFEDEVPDELFSNFSMPVTAFLGFHEDQITALVADLLEKFCQPKMMILEDYQDRVVIGLNCVSTVDSSLRFSTSVNIPKDRLRKYLAKD